MVVRPTAADARATLLGIADAGCEPGLEQLRPILWMHCLCGVRRTNRRGKEHDGLVQNSHDFARRSVYEADISPQFEAKLLVNAFRDEEHVRRCARMDPGQPDWKARFASATMVQPTFVG
jgi:hypothetical protein